MNVSIKHTDTQPKHNQEVHRISIYTLATKLLLAESIEATYKIVVDNAMELVGAKYGSIFMPQGNELVRIYTSDPLMNSVIPRKGGYIYETFRTNRPHLLLGSSVKAIREGFKKLKVGSNISIPLGFGGASVGVLSLLSPPERVFSQDDLETLRVHGSLASLALKGAQHVDLLEEAVEARDMFLSMAAHELRTPLTAIITYTHLLSRSIRPDNMEANDYLRHLIVSLKRLNTLINELLQIDKIKDGLLSYEMKSLALKPLIDQAIEEFLHTWPNRELRGNFRITEKEMVWGDEGKLGQVLYNILHNAHKFSPKEAPIRVRAFSYLNRFVIEISDQGDGIEKNMQKGIFRQYFKGTSNKEGMGLGLFLTKAIIDKHGGNISLKSKVKHGTVVRIELPAMTRGNKKQPKPTTRPVVVA